MADPDLQDRVLAHVTRYPGLSSHEIARALRIFHKGGSVAKRQTDAALMQLLRDGKVIFQTVPMDPTRDKQIWTAI